MQFSASDLEALRSELAPAGHGRYFDQAFGDILATWPLLLAIPLISAILCVFYTFGLTFIPVSLYMISLIGLASLSVLTIIFWTEGRSRLNSIAEAGLCGRSRRR